MARLKNPPQPAPRASSTAPDDSPPQFVVPAYVAPPVEMVSSETTAFADLIEQCRNASYSLLDLRDNVWQLLCFGSGANLRSFATLDEGIEFCRDLNLPNVRCLHIEGGIIR